MIAQASCNIKPSPFTASVEVVCRAWAAHDTPFLATIWDIGAKYLLRHSRFELKEADPFNPNTVNEIAKEMAGEAIAEALVAAKRGVGFESAPFGPLYLVVLKRRATRVAAQSGRYRRMVTESFPPHLASASRVEEVEEALTVCLLLQSARLEATTADLFRLRVVEQQPFEVIARTLGLSCVAVRKRWERLRKTLVPLVLQTLHRVHHKSAW